ncbi:MAG: hypothetical protein HQ536_03720 [Parcubacteria group bacterium]|nr:hypothetical protein [Parcubacteria group bacterium]
MKTTKNIKKLKVNCAVPHNNLFVTALVLSIAFLLVELGARIYDLYKYWPWIDVPSHFFAGMAITCIALWIISLSKLQKRKTVAICLTLVISIFWELLETIEEKITPLSVPPYLRDYFFWDGFWDILVAIFGGLFLLVVLHFLKKETDIYEGINI